MSNLSSKESAKSLMKSSDSKSSLGVKSSPSKQSTAPLPKSILSKFLSIPFGEGKAPRSTAKSGIAKSPSRGKISLIKKFSKELPLKVPSKETTISQSTVSKSPSNIAKSPFIMTKSPSKMAKSPFKVAKSPSKSLFKSLPKMISQSKESAESTTKISGKLSKEIMTAPKRSSSKESSASGHKSVISSMTTFEDPAVGVLAKSPFNGKAVKKSPSKGVAKSPSGAKIPPAKKPLKEGKSPAKKSLPKSPVKAAKSLIKISKTPPRVSKSLEKVSPKEAKAPTRTPSKEAKSPAKIPAKTRPKVKSPVKVPPKEAKIPSRTPSKEAKVPSEIPSKKTKAPSRSPSKEAKSPMKVSKSLTKVAAKSAVKAIKTPTKISKSPAKGVKTPTKISKSPAKIAKSPDKLAKSPDKLAKSPDKLAKSPDKLAKSPAKSPPSREEVAKKVERPKIPYVQSKRNGFWYSEIQAFQKEEPIATPVPLSSEIIQQLQQKGYSIQEFIGKGSFSIVWRARKDHRKNHNMAAKIYNVSNMSEQMKKLLPREIGIWAQLRCHTIITLHKTEKMTNYLVLMLELGREDLQKNLATRGCVRESDARIWTSHLVSALGYLHNNKIAHRDVKLENVIIDKGIAKLSDFGLATYSHHPYTKEPILDHDLCGSFHYLSPEVINQTPHDPRTSDVWSLAVVIFAMVTWTMPFGHNPDVSQSGLKTLLDFQKLNQYSWPKSVPLTFKLKEMITKMLTFDHVDRPNIDWVESNSWLVE